MFPSELLRFLLIMFTFGLQMLASIEPYFGYAYAANCSTQNISSVTWDLYAPNNELVSLQGIRISRSTNNIADYSAVIELLDDVISHGICCIGIRLDSKLVVLQLNNVYSIRSPTMFRMFMRVRLLEIYFDSSSINIFL